MKQIKISKIDKDLIKAYVKWHLNKYEFMPTEYEMSVLIDNMNGDHRNIVEEYLETLKP